MELEYLTQKYPMSDIGKMSSLGRRGGGHMLSRVEVDAGATNVVQRGYKRAKYGRKPKRNARLALRLIEAGQSEAIQRYQRIGTYEGFTTSVDGPGSLDLGHYTYSPSLLGTIAGMSLNYYPVQLFDVTSSKFFAPGGNMTNTNDVYAGRACYAPCQWRLVSFNSAPAGFNVTPGDFFFVPQPGQTRTGLSTAYGDQWRTERNTNTVEASSRVLGIISRHEYQDPFFADRAYLDWADIRMCLYGARAQTTKFTVSLVQITDRKYDVRETPPYTAPAVGGFGNNFGDANTWNDNRDRESQDNFNAAMQELVHPLVFHPMSSAGATKISPFKVLTSRSYIIGPDTDVNTDESQPNLLVKFFHRLNRICKYGWSDTPTVGNDIDVDGPKFNYFYNPQVRGYLHPRAKLYVMVTAQAYVKRAPAEFSTDVTPGMDIIIRRKIKYQHVTRPSGQNPSAGPS